MAFALGCVRNGVVLLRLYANTPFEDDDLGVEAVSVDGDRLRLDRHEAGPDQRQTLDHLESLLSPRTRRRLRVCRQRADLAAPYEEGRLYRAFQATQRIGAQILQGRWITGHTSVGHLLPVSEQNFRDYISFENRRPADPETALFICRQILMSDPEQFVVAGLPIGYLINTLVILIYKSVELERAIDPAELEAWTQRAMDSLQRLPRLGIGIRKDDDHLKVSLQTALWHYAVSQEDDVRAIALLTDIMEGQGQVLMKVNRSYNICRTGLMLGILLLASGRTEAAMAVFTETVEAFKRAVSLVEPDVTKTTWFYEMTDTHAATAHALFLLRRLQLQETFPPEQLTRYARAAVRIETEPFIAVVQAMITRLMAETATRTEAGAV